jgi:hypothetical protein
MAIKFFDCKGYGQIEPSQVWFTRAGMSESQCALDPDKFAAHFPMTATESTDEKIYAENGAFLMIDKQNKIATIPNEDMSKLGYKMGINYSTEKIYNQFTPGRRNFCMIAGEFLPRIGFVEPGMRICTNAVAWDSEADIFTTANPTDDSDIMYNDVKTALATKTDTPIYAVVTKDSKGKLVIGGKPADALGNVYAIVTEAYFNADNTKSFKIMFVNKPE